MILFAVCCNCQATVENRSTLDLAGFYPWTCPNCGAINPPFGADEVPATETEEQTDFEVMVEVCDAGSVDLSEGNLLEG